MVKNGDRGTDPSFPNFCTVEIGEGGVCPLCPRFSLFSMMGCVVSLGCSSDGLVPRWKYSIGFEWSHILTARNVFDGVIELPRTRPSCPTMRNSKSTSAAPRLGTAGLASKPDSPGLPGPLQRRNTSSIRNFGCAPLDGCSSIVSCEPSGLIVCGERVCMSSVRLRRIIR